MANQQGRSGFEFECEWPAAQTDSQDIDVQQGAFGTLIVPAGSELIGKSVQFVAVSTHSPARFADTELLSAAKVLAAGANALSEDEIREVGAASRIRLRLNSAVVAGAKCALLWKA